jgi:hypothetical protein
VVRMKTIPIINVSGKAIRLTIFMLPPGLTPAFP